MKLKSNYSVLSLSGGMDSTSLLLHLLSKNQTIYCLSFKYGQNHSFEIDKASENISYLIKNGFKDKLFHKIIDLTNVFNNFNSTLLSGSSTIPEGHYESKNMKSTFVPNRNAIFSSVLYGYALTLCNKINDNVTISMGVHSGDHEIYPDCRPDFFVKLFESFKIGNWDSEKIKLYLPYVDFNKTDILEDAEISINKLNLDFDIIFTNTITSYSPDNNGVSSGKSGSDIERILAFNNLNRKDPIKYKDEWAKVLKHALDVEERFKKK